MSSSFPSFVNMVKRKIRNDHRLIPFMKQVVMDEVEDILSQDSNVQIKVSLLTNLLRSFKIPLGVEGAGLCKVRRIRGHAPLLTPLYKK